ncbi:flagellar hook-basal body protein [Gracilibacillus alcaliphilus]|uniref:flagellar hook-basal body protein n=1 Tax=Gracilibacillus alcaliphilus TaxID=1401441 RepID=UPI00195B8B38|nr:flagellar hook-basal body protein [Gracilibacillus alcaliphilus]MBM7679731.1 flagellar basal-body rod protein FlgG [Gracilibacillus alcaliphilus]
MTRMTFQAAVAMSQLQQRLDNISNNLANSNTTGFKQREANFSSLLSQQMETEPDPANQLGRLTPDGLRIGTGMRIGHMNFQFAQGAIQETDRNLDVALQQENQFFQVLSNNNGQEEVHYTRAGNFYLTPINEGQVMLVNAEGNPVLGANEEAIILEDNMEDLKIDMNGDILVTRNGVQVPEAQLNVVQANRPRLLEAVNANEYRLSEDTLESYPLNEIINGVAANDLHLHSGALEQSNVDMSKQMTDMIETQRAYQLNAGTISMHDQMKGLINQLR